MEPCQYLDCTKAPEHLLVVNETDEHGFCDDHIREAVADVLETPMTYEVKAL